jgi:hypothetical protein
MTRKRVKDKLSGHDSVQVAEPVSSGTGMSTE